MARAAVMMVMVVMMLAMMMDMVMVVVMVVVMVTMTAPVVVTCDARVNFLAARAEGNSAPGCFARRDIQHFSPGAGEV